MSPVVRWLCVPAMALLAPFVAVGVGMLLVAAFEGGDRWASVAALCVATPLFIAAPALVAPSRRIAVAIGCAIPTVALAVWLLVDVRQPWPALIVILAAATVALLIWQSRYGDELTRWPMLRSSILRRLLVPVYVAGAVCAALGLMALLVVGHGSHHTPIKVRADLLAIGEALTMYRRDHGALPESAAGLAVLISSGRGDAGYLNRMPRDSWDRPYQYERSGDGYRVWSYGADGRPGGDDLDADIELRDGEIVP